MKTRIILGAIAVMVVTTSAVFAALLFTQTFPPVTRPSFTANCATLSVEGVIPPAGVTTFIRFDCGSGVAAFSAGPVTVTPTFTLPTGYTDLAVVEQSAPCDFLFTFVIFNGVSTTLAAGNYDYCALVDASTINLATFDISWNS